MIWLFDSLVCFLGKKLIHVSSLAVLRSKRFYTDTKYHNITNLITALLMSSPGVTWAMMERSPPLELCSLAGLGCQLVTLSSKIWDRDNNTIICVQFVLPSLLSYLLYGLNDVWNSEILLSMCEVILLRVCFRCSDDLFSEMKFLMINDLPTPVAVTLAVSLGSMRQRFYLSVILISPSLWLSASKYDWPCVSLLVLLPPPWVWRIAPSAVTKPVIIPTLRPPHMITW